MLTVDIFNKKDIVAQNDKCYYDLYFFTQEKKRKL